MNGHKKRCCPYSDRKMQIKATIKFYLLPTKVATI